MSDASAAIGFAPARDREVLAPAFEAAPLPMIGVNRAGRIALANRHAEALFGYAAGELAGVPFEELSPAGWRAIEKEFARAAPRSSEAGKGVPHSIVGTARDGAEIALEMGLTRVAAGETTYVLAVLVDLADTRRSEMRLRAVIDSSPNALILIDDSGKIALVNTEAEKLFGYRRDELFGRSVEQLVPRRFRNIHASQRDAFLQMPTARAMGAGRDLFGLCKDGSEIPIEIGLSPLQLPNGRFVLAGIIDISERKRAERLRILNADFGHHALATADVGLLEQQAVELIASAIDAPFVRLGEFDAARDALVVRAAVGWPGQDAEGYALSLEENPQEAESIRTGRAIFNAGIGDPSALEPAPYSRSHGIVASSTIPIRGKDSVVGLIAVGLRDARRLSPVPSVHTQKETK